MNAEKTPEESNFIKPKEIVSRNKLLEAGVYFGHKKSLWNPKMTPFLRKIDNDKVPSKRNIHLIDITKTKKALEFAYSLIEKLTIKGANFIFVGTRNCAKETIKHNALRTNSLYVSERWLGGTLTNWKTISERVKKMFRLEKMAENNFEGYTKKEGVGFDKELKKFHRSLSGIKNMLHVKPNIMIVADPKHDNIAVKEARKSGIKVIGIVDSNSDPTLVDVAVPGNDDSVKSVTLIITILADAIAKAKGGKQEFAFQDDENIKLPDEKRFNSHDDPKNKYRNANLRPTFSRIKEDSKDQNEVKFIKKRPEELKKDVNKNDSTKQ